MRRCIWIRLALRFVDTCFFIHDTRNCTRPGEAIIRFTVMPTVLLSIFAHGLSAQPGIRLYAAKIKSLGADAPENRIVSSELGISDLDVAPDQPVCY
ncbi:MAG TPA: hypothetical protein VFU09_01965 [Candidatus Udaeobacter sp.]|nr:hypothetical protein [Candidatus Udaeobacter sp.]